MSQIKLPAFTIQYYEHDKKIDFPVELFRTPLKVDGLFSPLTSNRFCLGYLNNFRRKQDSFQHLINFGLGIEFNKTDDDIYTIKNLSQQKVFILMKNVEDQYEVEPGVCKPVFDLKPLIQNKLLPKKLGKIYDDCSVRISFGVRFVNSLDSGIGQTSPSWLEMSLNQIVDTTD